MLKKFKLILGFLVGKIVQFDLNGCNSHSYLYIYPEAIHLLYCCEDDNNFESPAILSEAQVKLAANWGWFSSKELFSTPRGGNPVHLEMRLNKTSIKEEGEKDEGLGFVN